MTSDVWLLAFLRLGSLALIPERKDLETGVLDKKKVENLLNSDARYNSVLPHLNPVLVQRKPGNKPRGLKENVFSYWMKHLSNLGAHLEKEDEGDADCSADAESLE